MRITVIVHFRRGGVLDRGSPIKTSYSQQWRRIEPAIPRFIDVGFWCENGSPPTTTRRNRACTGAHRYGNTPATSGNPGLLVRVGTMEQKTRDGRDIKVPDVMEWERRWIRHSLIIISTKYFVIVNYGTASTTLWAKDQSFAVEGGSEQRERKKKRMKGFIVFYIVKNGTDMYIPSPL